MENNVLFVDDEIHILKAIKRGLIKEKYKKFFASSGAEALEILEQEDIHVIVSDMKMPQMNGLELLTIVNEKYPDIVKIILSGYTQLQQIIVTINRINIYKFLTKPWDMEDEFKQVLNSAIDLYNTRVENENLKKSLVKKNELYQNMIKSNSKKIELMQNDFYFLETLNKVLVNFYYLMGIKLKRGSIDESSYQNELSMISHLYEQIIKMMPTKHDDFNVRMLEDNLLKFLETNANTGNLPSKLSVTNVNAEGIYVGDYKVLSYTLTTMIYHYYGLENYDTFSLVITEKERLDDSGIAVEMLILLKSKLNNVNQDQLRLKTLTTFFTNLISAYKGALSFEERNEDHLLIIKFPFRRKQSDSIETA